MVPLWVPDSWMLLRFWRKQLWRRTPCWFFKAKKFCTQAHQPIRGCLSFLRLSALTAQAVYSFATLVYSLMLNEWKIIIESFFFLPLLICLPFFSLEFQVTVSSQRHSGLHKKVEGVNRWKDHRGTEVRRK